MTKTIASASLVLLAALLAACSGISKAPKGSPRMELEVAVTADPSFTAALADADDELVRAATERVLAMSDIGLRFYPVLSTTYGGSDPRPQYVMNVELKGLQVGVDHRTVKHEGTEPTIEAYVKDVACAANASMVKRRDSGPALTVGAATGKGTRQVVPPKEGAEGPSYAVKREAEQQPLRVRRDDIVLAVERAVENAFRGMIEPIDRELAQASGSAAGSSAKH